MGPLKYERFINLKLKSSVLKTTTGPYEKFVITSSMGFTEDWGLHENRIPVDYNIWRNKVFGVILYVLSYYYLKCTCFENR